MIGILISFVLGAVAMFVFKAKLVAALTPLQLKLTAKLAALKAKLIAFLSK